MTVAEPSVRVSWSFGTSFVFSDMARFLDFESFLGTLDTNALMMPVVWCCSGKGKVVDAR